MREINDFKSIVNNVNFSFPELKEKCVLKVKNSKKVFDISFIVPIRGRESFLSPLYDSFKKAKKANLKVSFLVVEHSPQPLHQDFCKENKIDYIFIPCKSKDLFNKCLCMNCGALWGQKCKNFIFHDVDCVVQSTFFENIIQNLLEKKSDALQTFTGRRVLYCSEALTKEIVKGNFDYDILRQDNVHVKPPTLIGAPGGSIFIKRETFFDVGGFDHILFQANSPEDAFFWLKIETVGKIDICDNPPNEIFHMSHPVTYNSNPLNSLMKRFYKDFAKMNVNERLEFINICKQKFQEWNQEKTILQL